jgi:hypothetical protein
MLKVLLVQYAVKLQITLLQEPVIRSVSASYIKYFERRGVAHRTQLVGTVIQKALKISEWKISAFHRQTRDQGRRVSSQYHQ